MADNEYLHELIKDLTDVLYDEHGIGAKYRMTLVGVQYFEKKYHKRLEKINWEDNLIEILDILKEEKIISDSAYTVEGNVLKVKLYSSIHLTMYKNLLPIHKKIIWSPCINAIMYFIDKQVGKQSEFVNMDINGNECSATIVMMKSA